MLVCADPALKTLDDRPKSELVASPMTRMTPLVEGQADWFRRSRRCAFQSDHRACVIAAYNERLAVVALDTLPASIQGKCLFPDGTTATVPVTGDSAVLTRDGRVIAVGLVATSSMQPFIRYIRSGDKARLRSLDDKPLATCRLDTGGRSR